LIKDDSKPGPAKEKDDNNINIAVFLTDTHISLQSDQKKIPKAINSVSILFT
jgi:hypothetical protein